MWVEYKLIEIICKCMYIYIVCNIFTKSQMMTSNNCFLMCVTGQVEWIDILASSGSSFHCKYEFVFGPDWKIIKGLEAAVSQVANVVTNGEKIVLNLPIDIVFKSTNPLNWPQIVLSVYKDMKLVGYGRTFVPIQPNLHTVDVVLIKPLPSTFLGFIGTFFGYQPELLQPKMLAISLGTDMIMMSSNGKVRLTLNVLQQGLQKLGYVTRGRRSNDIFTS